MPAQRALVIEDMPELAEIASVLLADDGFDVSVASDGATGLALARTLEPEIILLDLTLPDIDGIDVCRELRTFCGSYVIMLTARDTEIDRVAGLTVGADDYVTKPFSPAELMARVRAMRRRPRLAVQEASVREFGGLQIDVESREVRVFGTTVELTKIEFDLLDLLSASPKRAFTREQVLRYVWGSDWYGDDHVIDVHMANLRRKIGPAKYIHTVRGVGYQFKHDATD